MSRAPTQLLIVAVSLLACTSAGEPSEQHSAEPIGAITVPEAPKEDPVAEPWQPAVIEIDVAEGSPDGETVPIAPVAPTPLTVSWTERASFDETLGFVPLTGGVLARSPSGYRELDDEGQLVSRPELELPEGELLGYWPDAAWHVKVETDDAEGDEPRYYYTMSTFERGGWVQERRRGATRWRDGEVQFRKGWHGGLLLRKDTNITRIGSKRGKPRAGARKGKELVDMFETRSGRLYTISSREGSLYVQANCSDLDCVEANAKRIPRGQDWRFSLQTPRQSNDVSMLATLSLGERDAHYLLSYEDHGWVLEPLQAAPAGMWPDDEGGLWLIVEGKLLHRDGQRSWHEVAAPGSGQGISAAILVDRSQLWLATSAAGHAEVFSTAGAPALEPSPE